jgi:Tol biopolymer transport system component
MPTHRLARTTSVTRLVTALALASGGCTGRPQPRGDRDPGALETRGPGLTQLAEAPGVRRVAAGGWIDIGGHPSPDGRYLTMTEWDTGNLALRDLAADTTILLTHERGWENGFAEGSVISPDGRSIAFGWYVEDRSAYELRIMSVAGADSGTVRVAYRAPEVDWVSPQSWTPDGRQVLLDVGLKDRTGRIAAVTVTGCGDGRCPVRVLKGPLLRGPGNIVASPDGRWAAFDFPPSEGEPGRDVYVVALDGSRETRVTRGGGDNAVLGWSVDGSHLLFLSDRGGTRGAWAVAVADGRPRAEPVLVRSDLWRAMPLGTTPDGRIFYTVFTGRRELLTAVIDPPTGSVASPPTSVSGGGDAGVRPWVSGWSSNGQYLAYPVGRSGTALSGSADVMIRSLERGDVRRVSPKMASLSTTLWFPDGRSLLLTGPEQQGRLGIYRMDLRTGGLTPLWRGPRLLSRSPKLSPDGTRLYFAAPDSVDNRRIRVHVLDVATGALRTLAERPMGSGHPTVIAVSPDGRTLALLTATRDPLAHSVTLMSVDGGPMREIYRTTPPRLIELQAELAWTADGRAILFGQADEDLERRGGRSAPVELMRVPVDGGAARRVGIRQPRIQGMSLSPDGRRLAFGVHEYMAELWAMAPPKLGGPAPRSR